MKTIDHSPRVWISVTKGCTIAGRRIRPRSSAAATPCAVSVVTSVASYPEAPKRGLDHGPVPSALGEHGGEGVGRRLFQQHGGHDAHPALLEIEQVALAQVPTHEVRRIPEAHATALPARQPGEKGFGRVVIVPARAEDGEIDVIETGPRHIPGDAGDGDPALFEGLLNVAVALGDVRPRAAGDEAHVR